MKWLKGLVSAIVSGAASAVAVMIVDPQHFNLRDQWGDVVLVAVVAGLLQGATYLKMYPTPWEGDERRATRPGA